MEICIADRSHSTDLKRLWKHCFDDDDEFINFWFDTVFKPQNTIIAKDNDAISGALQIVFYDINIHGNIYKSAYLCGVGVYQQYRSRGIGSKLMQFAHEHLKKSGVQLLFLISEADNFYKKLGYVTGCSKYLCKTLPEINNAVNYTVLKNKFPIADMMSIYNAYCKNYDGYIIRDANEFEYLITHYSMYPGGTYLLYVNNIPSAYVICEADDNILKADEIAYINDDGFSSIIDFIKNNTAKNTSITVGDFELKNLKYDLITRTIWYLPLDESIFLNDLNQCFFSIL